MDDINIEKPVVSDHFKGIQPSAIRSAQIDYSKRRDDVKAINTAIGNVSLHMYLPMQWRMFNLDDDKSPFKDGVVMYSPTVGFDETRKAFLNVIASSGCDTKGLYPQITAGGSEAMEFVILGACGPTEGEDKPVLLIDAAYTNYKAMADRAGISTISVRRHLQPDGKFTLPDINELEAIIKTHNPGAMIVIPYDNPTGHFYDHDTMVKLGKLCVDNNLWMVSDEAYRELHYVKQAASSIWRLTDKDVPGIEGRRISIETVSKIFNGCGLRIGALVTDNEEFHKKAVNEGTANLCANVIGQWIVGALAHKSHRELQEWYSHQRNHYQGIMSGLVDDLKQRLPGVIVSNPDASIYSVVDVRDIANRGFDAKDFVKYCAEKGVVELDDGRKLTLLVAPMAGFYSVKAGEENPGDTQMRIAHVESPENLKLVPQLFTELFKQYEAQR